MAAVSRPSARARAYLAAATSACAPRSAPQLALPSTSSTLMSRPTHACTRHLTRSAPGSSIRSHVASPMSPECTNSCNSSSIAVPSGRDSTSGSGLTHAACATPSGAGVVSAAPGSATSLMPCHVTTTDQPSVRCSERADGPHATRSQSMRARCQPGSAAICSVMVGITHHPRISQRALSTSPSSSP